MIGLTSIGLGPPVGAQEPAPHLTMVMPDPLFAEGDVMHLLGSGFPPDTEFLAGECMYAWIDDPDGGFWRQENCAGSTMDVLRSDSGGSIDGQIPVAQGIQLGDPDVGPTLAVTPSTGLVDGQVVTVSGANFPTTSNTFDCNSDDPGRFCAAAIVGTLDESNPGPSAVSDVRLAGLFAAAWTPPDYSMVQTVTQQLEAIIYAGDLDDAPAIPAPDNLTPVAVPIDPATGTFTMDYAVSRHLEFTHVVYPIEGHPQPVWQVTWPPPEGLQPYDYTFDCVFMPEPQEGREIQDPTCRIVVMSGSNPSPIEQGLLEFQGPELSIVPPSEPLVDGSPIELQGSGFDPGEYQADLCLFEFADDPNGGHWERGNCSGSNGIVTADDGGILTGTVPAVQGIAYVEQFGTKVTVTPADYLVDGQIVTVTGVNLPALDNTFDCQRESSEYYCGIVVHLGTQDDPQSGPEIWSANSLAGMFAGDWEPPEFWLVQTVTQQLEGIYYTGPEDGALAAGMTPKRLYVDRMTGAFSTTFKVSRWLELTDVAYPIVGHEQPPWPGTEADPIVPYDYTFDCARLPARQADRDIEDPQCQLMIVNSLLPDEGVITFADRYLTLSADATGRITKKPTQVVVQGRVTCTDPAMVHLEGTLTQTGRKGTVVSAIVRTDVSCTGTAGWSATTYAASGSFAKGSAVLTLDATSPGFTPIDDQVMTVTLVTTK